MADQTQLDDQIVQQLLHAGLCDGFFPQVAFKVNIQKGRNASDAVCRAVLFLLAAQISKVEPLNRFVGIFRRAGDVAAVFRCHLDQCPHKFDLSGNVLQQTDGFVRHILFSQSAAVLLLLQEQKIHAVKRQPAIVSNQPATAVGIGKPRKNTGMPRLFHGVGVNAENAGIVRCAVGKLLADVVADIVTVSLAGLFCVADTGKRIDCAFQRLFGLQTENNILSLTDITGGIRQNGGNTVGIHIKHAALFLFLPQHFLHTAVKPCGALGRTAEKGLIAFVRRVVSMNKITDINFCAPVALVKRSPGFHTVNHPFLLSAGYGKLCIRSIGRGRRKNKKPGHSKNHAQACDKIIRIRSLAVILRYASYGSQIQYNRLHEFCQS